MNTFDLGANMYTEGFGLGESFLFLSTTSYTDMVENSFGVTCQAL